MTLKLDTLPTRSRQEIETVFLQRITDNNGMLFQEILAEINEQSEEDKKKRRISGIAATGDVINRNGWLLRIKGMDIAHFKANPVALAVHAFAAPATLMPAAIGTVGNITKRGNTLKFSNLVFDDDPLAEAWYQKIVKRFVRMVSIGYKVLDYEFGETEPKGKSERKVYYLDITKSELVEVSVTPIGADRTALIKQNRREEEEDAAATGRLEARIEALEQHISRFNETLEGLKTQNVQQAARSVENLQRALAPFVSQTERHRKESKQ